MKIIDIEIKDLIENINQNKMEISLDQSAKDFLADKGFDPKFGARPLRRAIQKYIEDPLAEEILKGSFKQGSKILVKHMDALEEVIFVDDIEVTSVSDEQKEITGNTEV